MFNRERIQQCDLYKAYEKSENFEMYEKLLQER